MKKNITLFLLVILLTSCGVSIKSIVDTSVKRPFRNPLIVIPFEKPELRNFSNMLKSNIEFQFQTEKKRVQVFVFEKEDLGLTLNANENSGIDQKVNRVINDDQKDLLIIFKPTHLQYYDSGLQAVTYEVVGINTQTQREVWKATLATKGTFGPGIFAERSAKTIYQKLKTDGIL